MKSDHLSYQDKMRELEVKKEKKIQVAETWKNYQLQNIMNTFAAELQQFNDEYDEETQHLKEKMVGMLNDRQKRISEEKDSLRLTDGESKPLRPRRRPAQKEQPKTQKKPTLVVDWVWQMIYNIIDKPHQKTKKLFHPLPFHQEQEQEEASNEFHQTIDVELCGPRSCRKGLFCISDSSTAICRPNLQAKQLIEFNITVDGAWTECAQFKGSLKNLTNKKVRRITLHAAGLELFKANSIWNAKFYDDALELMLPDFQDGILPEQIYTFGLATITTINQQPQQQQQQQQGSSLRNRSQSLLVDQHVANKDDLSSNLSPTTKRRITFALLNNNNSNSNNNSDDGSPPTPLKERLSTTTMSSDSNKTSPSHSPIPFDPLLSNINDTNNMISNTNKDDSNQQQHEQQQEDGDEETSEEQEEEEQEEQVILKTSSTTIATNKNLKGRLLNWILSPFVFVFSMISGPPKRILGNTIPISYYYLFVSAVVVFIVHGLHVTFKQSIPLPVWFAATFYLFMYIDNHVYSISSHGRGISTNNQSSSSLSSSSSSTLSVETKNNNNNSNNKENNHHHQQEMSDNNKDLSIKEKIRVYEEATHSMNQKPTNRMTPNGKHHNRSHSGGSSTTASLSANSLTHYLPPHLQQQHQLLMQQHQLLQQQQQQISQQQQSLQQQQQQTQTQQQQQQMQQTTQLSHFQPDFINTVPNLPTFASFSSFSSFDDGRDSSGSFYRTRPYDNHRRSLPPGYYNQYLNYNLNYKNNHLNHQHNKDRSNKLDDRGGGGGDNDTDPSVVGSFDDLNGASDGSDDNNNHDSDGDDTIVKETKEELSELENIKKVKSNITHFTKLSSNLEEKLDWQLSPFTISPPRCSNSIAVYGMSLVSIGGEGIKDINSIVQFIDADKGLSTTPKVTGGKIAPESIYLHDMCRIGNKFYLYGGMVGGKMSNKVYVITIIDDSTVHWSQPRINSYSPSPRIGHTLTRYGNRFILFGGFDGEKILNDTHLLDPETMTWSTLAATGNPPSERYGHSSTILGEKLIVFGGSNRTKDLNDINILQLDSYEWIQPIVQGSEIPPERSFHAATRVGRNLIVVGGKRENVTHRDIWTLSYKMLWTKVTGIQITPHSHHALIKNGSNLYILGGKGQGGNILDDIWFVNTTNLPISSSVTMINYPDIKIEKEIGKGHFSKVLRGVWKGKDVAVKKLNLLKDKPKEEMMNEFKAEVELLGSLQHPNLVNCYGYCVNPMCIVMEFLPTGNLFDLIHSRENKMDSTLLLQFAFDIARGMQHLHSRSMKTKNEKKKRKKKKEEGRKKKMKKIFQSTKILIRVYHLDIIHRDLKSSNLLLDKHFNIKIADLGIARETSFTQTMTTIGTVAWTAPEILRHDSYNQKADVYSYAIVLWELLTGEEPYAGIPPMNAGILVASKELRPELPDNCDPNWKKLVVWCWQEDQNKRPSFTDITKYLTNTF
ncbi:Kelch repeat-containing protein [Cavenderia fasciculata]|uniref:Kelch repeat-containing protein n=1 Tax=Cavenderia fasciculata TaxID=261658 RepID=F4QBV9_CACFS|nr:Kelch repeat-containing protein [Cavenderia fasciculata]EGG14697.1 Kelch repeat-containing protein [Cavenderia fasciculata]|eukprot:XP_004351205.1 Kelch repeat-containing protein [Cavenderia fasciculata]